MTVSGKTEFCGRVQCGGGRGNEGCAERFTKAFLFVWFGAAHLEVLAHNLVHTDLQKYNNKSRVPLGRVQEGFRRRTDSATAFRRAVELIVAVLAHLSWLDLVIMEGDRHRHLLAFTANLDVTAAEEVHLLPVGGRKKGNDVRPRAFQSSEASARIPGGMWGEEVCPCLNVSGQLTTECERTSGKGQVQSQAP